MGIPSYKIEVSKSVIADCSKAHEVKEKILSLVLQELIQNLDNIYNNYWASCQQNLNRLRSEVNQKLEQARETCTGTGAVGDLAFKVWFKEELWPNLKGQMIDKRDELDGEQSKNDQLFHEKVKQVLEACLTDEVIPSLQDIGIYRNDYDGSYKMAYYQSIIQVQKKLRGKFEELADFLKKSEEKLQLSLVEILVEHGNLGVISPHRNLIFFNDIYKEILKNNHDSARTLQEAFDEVRKSTDTYEKTILAWIEPDLDELNPDRNLDPISQKQNYDIFTQEEVETIESDLSALTEEDVSKLDENINDSISQFVDALGDDITKMIGMTLPLGVVKILTKSLLNQLPFLIKGFSRASIPTENVNSQSYLFVRSFSEENKQLIQNEMKSLRDKVVANCQTTLENKLNFPNKEAYTKCNSFVTNAFTGYNLDIPWEQFYDNKKDVLWPNAVRSQENKIKEQKWQNLVNSAIEANQEI